MWSSLPSDRIKSKSNSNANSRQPSRAQTPKAEPIPKSKAVLALEATIDAFEAHPPTQKDPKGGCFCQARMHPIARPSARLCLSCGLALCALNPPYAACPSCATPVLSPHARAETISAMHQELEKQIALEHRQREDEARRVVAAAGAFPTLPAHKPAPPPPPPQQHKVMSLNSKTRKYVVQTRSSVPTPSQSPSPAPPESIEEEPLRIPPPSQPAPAKGRVDGRIWVNLLGDAAKYIAPPPAPNQPKSGNRRRPKKAQATEWVVLGCFILILTFLR